MPWTLNYEEKTAIVELVLEGRVTGDALRAATSAAIQRVQDTGACRGLIDASAQEQTGTVLDLYQLPDQYAAEGLSRHVTIALVAPRNPALEELARFYENVCINRGWTVRSFGDRGGALAWLLTVEL